VVRLGQFVVDPRHPPPSVACGGDERSGDLELRRDARLLGPRLAEVEPGPAREVVGRCDVLGRIPPRREPADLVGRIELGYRSEQVAGDAQRVAVQGSALVSPFRGCHVERIENAVEVAQAVVTAANRNGGS
jgi:hypothetical protein